MLHLHRSERADALVDALAELLLTPLPDPLQAEVIAVPTRGIERWLTQQLSATLGASDDRQDGVCANVAFPFPGRVIGGAVAAASGVDRSEDPWLPERIVWPLLELVDASLDEAWLAPLASHLTAESGESEEGARRFASVRHLADLFDNYAVHRPEMLRAWASGGDTDGSGAQIPDDLRWQSELWRHLRQRIGAASPAERLPEACAALRERPALVDIPERFALFGLTRLPVSYLEVLEALATHRSAHLYLLHPSPALWDRIEALAPPKRAIKRADDPTAYEPHNPLLASWGRDAREMQLALSGMEHDDEHLPVQAGASTLLAGIQKDVRSDREPPGLPAPGTLDLRPPLGPDDRSIQVHDCHGRARQVEVARDAILHLLREDPSLEPRDVLVMCPDVEAFAPLVHAAFAGAMDEGGADDRGAPDLRVRLADRSLRQTNPLLDVLSDMIDLAGSRVTNSQVVDLLGRPPVRRRFGFDDEDLERIEEWVTQAGVRWGLDAPHRAAYGLDDIACNTWRAGLDRILAGIAMSEDDLRLVGGVLPLDDVESGAIDLVGRLAEFVDRLASALDALTHAKPIAGWAESLVHVADLLTAVGRGEEWQRAQLDVLLGEAAEAAVAPGGEARAELALTELRALLADRLRGQPTRANFRTGHMTVCTLVPMRSVPHRVVCLMGLDDGEFPRKGSVDGDDVLGHDPRVGERDARAEDRQLLLDALMAATEHLVITYAGRDETTNAERPPAVPLGELLDAIDATVRLSGDPEEPPRRQVVVSHPLQPFDARNFSPGALGRAEPFGFDQTELRGARALGRPAEEPAPFLGAPLPPTEDAAVQLDDLVRFVENPARAFLRRRLNVSFFSDDGEPDDAIPIELGGLGNWGVGDRMLAARRAGCDETEARKAELVRGHAPPGALADGCLDDAAEGVAGILDIAATATGHPIGETGSVGVNVELPDGKILVGTVPGVVDDLVLTLTYSTVRARQRLAQWARFLAVAAAHPERPWRSVLVGKRDEAATTLGPFCGDEEDRYAAAMDQLAVLLDLFDRGMREPVPIYCATSAAYAEAVHGGKDAAKAARGPWANDRFSPETVAREHLLTLGGPRSLEKIIDGPSRADEAGPGWETDQPSRFVRYALRLWGGIFAAQEEAR